MTYEDKRSVVRGAGYFIAYSLPISQTLILAEKALTGQSIELDEIKSNLATYAVFTPMAWVFYKITEDPKQEQSGIEKIIVSN